MPAQSLHGAHTERALENFPLAGEPVHGELARAFGTVKLACARTNRALGAWAGDEAKADAIERACRELADGELAAEIVVDRLQGGAGTSTNMNVNEVLANRALQLLGEPPGSYARVSPLDDVNLHQSTNDTYPTALRLAAITLLHRLEEQVVTLQEAFQQKEQAFAHVVKVGRTQYQDAVLTTLGREMGAYAEALNRDRWRIYKCEERLRVVNLGGTAIGTGFAAPRQYIFRVVDTLRELTSIGFARAENLTEATQNADVFVEVSGILKAHAMTLLKICGDLRLLSSGPEAGLGEIRLPPAAGRLQHHARQGQPRDPRGREPGGPAGRRLRRHHRRRRRPRQPRAQRLPAAHRRLPAAEPLAAGPRRRDPAPLLRRGPGGRRGALRDACARFQRRRHRPGARDRLRGGLRRRARRPGGGRDDPRRRRRRRPPDARPSTRSCSRPRPSAASARPSRSAAPWRTDTWA